MTARARFLFDADFGPVKETDRRVAPEQHQAALAAAEQRGYQRGFAAAEAQARGDVTRRTAAAYDRIAGALSQFAGEMKAIEHRIEAEAVAVAVAVARSLAGALIAREPLVEIAALATDCFGVLLTAPHLVVRVNTDLYPSARERLEEIARATGFEGRLVVLGENDIAPGDCRIEWADGGAVRERRATEAAIDEIVAGYTAAHAGP